MLLEFKTKNYKSFVEETTFSMFPAPKQKGLDYSVFKYKIKSKDLKTLSSSVIYGPNASGKTNIIGAMDVLKSIVLRGHIRNVENNTSPNEAAFSLELIPNNKLKSIEPVEFDISFVDNDMHVNYSLKLDLGEFLNPTYKRSVKFEQLSINDKVIFRRDTDLHVSSSKVIQQNLKSTNETSLLEVAKNSLNEEELFLTNGFKLIYAQELVKCITEWLSNKLSLIYRADSMKVIQRARDSKGKSVYIEKVTNEAAKIFGINSNSIAYVVDDKDQDPKLCSILDLNKKGKVAITAEIFESYGTIRFINIFPLIIHTLKTGGTLVVDEFDASIHPMALMNIINIFHNDDININQAQLIFNTHNPIFLNSNLFRRDEIKFIDKSEDDYTSVLYQLSDFKTSGDNSVRKGADYMKNYFISRYGAIKDVDFTPIFEQILLEKSED